MADNQNPRTAPNEVATTNVNSSPGSGSAVASAPSDSVQKPAIQATKVPKTAKDWEEYEAAHVARTGPPCYRFEQFIEKLESKALKEQEVRLLGNILQILAYTGY
jgi:hypothetical protein